MIVSSIVRTFQLIFAVIVLALSVTAARWQQLGKVPAVTGFNCFNGAFTLLVALIGFVAIFVSAIPGIAIAALDFLAFIFLLAGGIAYAVYIRGVDCTNTSLDPNSILYSGSPLFNFLMNEGLYLGLDPNTNEYTYQNPNNGYLQDQLGPNCRKITADTVFIFLAMIASLAAGILALLAHRRGGHNRHGRTAAV